MHSSIKDDEFYNTRQELMDRDMNKTNDYTTKMKNILRCKYTYRLKTVDQQASLHKLRYNLNDEKALADLEKFHNINAEQEVIELLEKEREWLLQQAKDNKNES